MNEALINTSSTMALGTCSLLVSTYNWPEALELVLTSIVQQTIIPTEVVIADDGSKPQTAEVINAFKNKLNIKHVWHEDKGFRKTLIMNNAIKEVSHDYIIQIDGDMLLHPNFVEDHLHFAKENFFIKGSRAMLPSNFTQQVLRKKELNFSLMRSVVKSKINATRLPKLAFLFFGSKTRTNNLRGCNFAFWKKDFIAVNGYNNNLTGWGHEDIELAARLVNNGVYRRQLKMAATCFHLYHHLNERNNESQNLSVYYDTIREKTKTIPNGYNF